MTLKQAIFQKCLLSLWMFFFFFLNDSPLGQLHVWCSWFSV